MSDAAQPDLEQLVAELQQVAERLRAADVAADDAVSLVEDTVARAAEATAELERQLRSAPPDRSASSR